MDIDSAVEEATKDIMRTLGVWQGDDDNKKWITNRLTKLIASERKRLAEKVDAIYPMPTTMALAASKPYDKGYYQAVFQVKQDILAIIEQQ